MKAAIFAVMAVAALAGCAEVPARPNTDPVRALPRQRIGASVGGEDIPISREEAQARQKEIERERWMNPAPPP